MRRIPMNYGTRTRCCGTVCTRLSAAVLRVSASLDLNTVLQEVVESARALTGARYGAITTIDAVGQPRDFVSSGLTPAEHRQLLEWSDGPRLFEYFRELRSPLRLQDLPAYVRSLGISSDLMLTKTLQATPMRHRGTQVGNFFLGDKQRGQEFTDEDEEVLMLFAAQAATAIANARTYRDEQRARADLEALIDTSPVGVVVFEVSSGAAVSINQEAQRIVDGLRMPGRSPEELLEVVTCQRAEGQEVSLAEFPLAQQLSSAETVRAEEIVLSVPDGRRVKTLINATPIRSADGEVESVVVTMQDLPPLEELERMRTEFLSMVSHELRAPLSSIKGSAATVLGASRRLDAAEVRQFFRIIEGQADQMDGLISDLLDAGRIETGTLSVDPEPTDVTALVDQARNTFISGGGRHAVRMDLPPELPRVMADRQRIVQVLNNLLSNAARHSPDSSPIQISATVDGVHVAISVSDEGRGVVQEQLPHLFRKQAGLAGGGRERGAGGYGLGLAICKGLVEAHGGRIRADSAGVGQGTRVTFTIPVLDDSRGSAAAGLAASDPPGEGRKQQASIVRRTLCPGRPRRAGRWRAQISYRHPPVLRIVAAICGSSTLAAVRGDGRPHHSSRPAGQPTARHQRSSAPVSANRSDAWWQMLRGQEAALLVESSGRRLTSGIVVPLVATWVSNPSPQGQSR